MPTVSVIIPAFNSGAYLDEAVQSVIAQTFLDWECLVVDDGSVEDLSRVGQMDTRVRLMRQPNRGTSAARNAGILNSKGKFIAFLDHDDRWLPQKLERQIEVLNQNPTTGLCYGAVECINAAGEYVSGPWLVTFRSWEDMLGRGAPQLSTTIIRREVIEAAGLFDPLYPVVQDMDLFLKIARFYPIIHVPDVVLQYREHQNNTSKKIPTLYLESASVVMKHRSAVERTHTLAGAEAIRQGWKMVGAQALDAARACVQRRQLASAARHLYWAFRYAPLFTARSLARWAFGTSRVPALRSDH